MARIPHRRADALGLRRQAPLTPCPGGVVRPLTVYLLADASQRVYDLSPAGPTPGDQAGPTVPTKKERADAQRAGEPAKEARCQTAPGQKQAGMSDEDCVFIASQVPVLMSNIDQQVRTDKTVPSPALSPGSDVPPDVKLKPLPAPVTERLTALQGFRYFLAGQDIVVVGRDEKVADVKVRP